MSVCMTISALLIQTQVRLTRRELQSFYNYRIFDPVSVMARLTNQCGMFPAECIACFPVIKFFLIELSNTCIAPQVFLVAIHTCTGCILKMVPMLRRNCFTDLRMTIETFLSCDLFSLFVASCAVVNTFQLFVRTCEFSGRDLCRRKRPQQSHQNHNYGEAYFHLENPGISHPESNPNMCGKCNKHDRRKWQMNCMPVVK